MRKRPRWTQIPAHRRRTSRSTSQMRWSACSTSCESSHTQTHHIRSGLKSDVGLFCPHVVMWWIAGFRMHVCVFALCLHVSCLVLWWRSVFFFTSCPLSSLFLFLTSRADIQITHVLLGGRRSTSMTTVTVWRGRRMTIRCCYGRISQTTTCPARLTTPTVLWTATEAPMTLWVYKLKNMTSACVFFF